MDNRRADRGDRSVSENKMTIRGAFGSSDQKWVTIRSVVASGSWRKTLQLCLIIFMLSLPTIAAPASALIWLAHGHSGHATALLQRGPGPPASP